ncbi:MAG: damage-control phosphatase ARMT1 family protein [Anaerolineae bacterium]
MDSLPPQICVAEPGSFAEYTLLHRLPHILQDVRDQHTFPPDIQANLAALLQELSNGQVQPIVGDSPDAAFWRQAWIPWQDCTWHQLPWFFAETYFYRRILDAVHYFYPGPWQWHDPFTASKQLGLQQGIERISTLLQEAPDASLQFETFRFWLFRSLWSNRSDFSNLVSLAYSQNQPSAGNDGLLVDDSLQVWDAFQGGKIERLDIVCDNAGPELLTDLAFADMLLTQKLTGRVVLQVKAQPYYVSDAMILDVNASVQALRTSTEKVLSALGARLLDALQDGRLSCSAHPFWTTCLTLFQIPPDLLQDLSHAQLIVFKGDVNYRRLLDDRHWPSTIPLAQVPNQVPCDYVTLRTVKSELICGLANGQSELMAKRDPDWLINGRWGLVQYVTRPRI